MPLDAIFCSALADELDRRLEGGRIDKVQQPARDMILLGIRAKGENLRLLLSAGPGTARAHITEASFENPAQPPMFCMLLRKHLLGAALLKVEQPDGERILILRLEHRDELGENTKKCLVLEMIGRSANLILVDGEGRIVDCLRRVDLGADGRRSLLPGMIYRLPPRQDKPSFFSVEEGQLRAMVAGADRDLPIDKWLLDNLSGLSPLICRELECMSGGYDGLAGAVMALRRRVAAGELGPWAIDREDGVGDFSFMEVRQYGAAARCRRVESFSRLLDDFYSQRDRQEQQRRRSQELRKSVRSARDRLQRKLLGQRVELERTEQRDLVRRQAELITANLYRIKKGDRSLVCQDYYEPSAPEIRIPLDERKTPQQNAAALFKEYTKLKAARSHLSGLIEQGEQELDYLNSVLAEIDRAETDRDLSDIRRELDAAGLLRKKKSGKTDKNKSQGPLRFVSDDGLEILVGRSNLQNDELTLKLARRTDYWLHTQRIHGSHVIVRCQDTEPPVRTLEQAASLAVYYSQARDGGKTPVDCTMVRHVRKPSGALPGMVIYTEQRTILAQGDEELVKALKG